MKKIVKRIVILVAAVALAFGFSMGMQKTPAQAASAILVRVPLDGTLYNHGVRVPETALASTGVVNGRIHQIACANTGVAFSYKEYAIFDFEDFSQLAAYDGAGNPMQVSVCKAGFVDYTGATPAQVQSVENIVTAAAIAYNERVSGRSSDENLAKYFQKGSIAYNNAVNSDSGRRWGAFYTVGAIKNAFVWDVYFYSPVDFVAKATVSAGTYFADNYTIAMLFHNNGAGYKVTYLTYMN